MNSNVQIAALVHFEDRFHLDLSFDNGLKRKLGSFPDTYRIQSQLISTN